MSFIDEKTMAVTRLAMLPSMSAERLRKLLSAGEVNEILALITAWNNPREVPIGDMSSSLQALLVTQCSKTIRRPLGELWSAVLRENLEMPPSLSSMDVRVLGDDDYPSVLADDRVAPAAIFTRGDIGTLNARRVGIVGTRNATEYGRQSAAHFARVLSQHGVAVISGLARGIDAAAHRGVLGAMYADAQCAGPVAVVATGLDVVYPREHAGLWKIVGERGLIISESPPGTEPLPYRFPLRNRIIAALSEVLLVVESRVDGGSLITVREALDRGVTVMAVPGATTTKASQGTNMLIRDGALIAIEPDDVLMALGLDTRRQVPAFDSRLLPNEGDGDVLHLFGSDPLTLDDVSHAAQRDLGLSFGDVALALGRLQALGWLMCTSGWFERMNCPNDLGQ